MTAAQQLGLAPVPTTIDNVDQWTTIAQQIQSESGLGTTVTPDLIVGMVAGAVALLFQADAAKDASILRGSFSDAVIAQCQRFPGSLMGARPASAVIELVGAHMADGHPQLRVHLSIEVHAADGEQSVNRQFWDLQLGGEVTVAQAQCPNCGAPLAPGELICAHCQTDVRSVLDVPLVVSRLEFY